MIAPRDHTRVGPPRHREAHVPGNARLMVLAALAVPAVAGSSTYVTDWRTHLNSDACRARLAEEHAFMSAAGRPTGLYCKSRPVLFSPSQRLAYVKTPKSASLAIQDLFQKQFTDYRWAQAHEDLPDDTFTFTFVREPLKRAMSAYAEIDVAYALRASPESHAAMRTVFDKVNRKPGPRETPRVLAFLDDLLDHRFGGDDREHWMPTHAYSSSKAAVVMLTRHLAIDLAPAITVNALCPGPFHSRMMRATLAGDGEAIAAQGTLLKRVGGPVDIVGAALLLASRAGGYITGVALPVEGGVLLSKM